MSPQAVYVRFQLKMEGNFTIHALQAGRVSMEVMLHQQGHDDVARAMAVSSSAHVVGSIHPLSDNAFENPVITIRKQRMADFVFNSAAAAIAIIISFGIGCATKVELVKQQLKFPVSLIVAFLCQIVIMPLLAFGLASLLQIDNETRFGFLCVACVPGGGMGHMAAVISKNSVPLSLTTNMISVVSMLGTAPLWIFVLGQYFHTVTGPNIIPIYNFEIWLAATFFAYSVGLLTSRFKETLAEGLLTWIIKPLLLLTTILYITVGVYINMYVFEDVNGDALLGAILLPFCGFIVGYVFALIFRQKPEFCKTIAMETSSLNCLIVVAALRFSLDQRDADLASIAPIWVMFTIPGMYITLTILKKFSSCVSGFLENQKQKQYKNFSLASGILNQANMTTLSAPLFIGEGIDDSNLNSNEKVTVV